MQLKNKLKKLLTGLSIPQKYVCLDLVKHKYRLCVFLTIFGTSFVIEVAHSHGEHTFLNSINQFVNQQRKKLRKSTSTDVSLAGFLLEQVRITYAGPRIISVIRDGNKVINRQVLRQNCSTLAHIRQYYPQWRLDKELPTEMLFR